MNSLCQQKIYWSTQVNEHCDFEKCSVEQWETEVTIKRDLWSYFSKMIPVLPSLCEYLNYYMSLYTFICSFRVGNFHWMLEKKAKFIAEYKVHYHIQINFVCLFGFNVAFKHLRSQCLLVAVVLWPMCCHTGMSCRRHRTRHPTPTRYTDTGPTCRCAILWCGTPHWNTQLLILMFWVRPDREILPWLSTHTSESSTLCCHGGSQSEVQQKVQHQPGLEPGTCGVQIHYTIHSPTATSSYTN